MSGMKMWLLSENVPANGAVHEVSSINPETVKIYIHKIITVREGNCNTGQTSNLWVCLPDQGDILITTHFNDKDGWASSEQFDYPRPFEIAIGEEVEIGVFGSGGTGNMSASAQIFYTTSP